MTVPLRRVAQPVDTSCVNLRPMPSPQDYLDGEDLDRAVLEASRLAWVVHEYDREQVCAVLRHIEATGGAHKVMVALAAMVNVEAPLSDLLGWVWTRGEDPPAPPRKPWQRAEGYPPCDPGEDDSPSGCGSPHATPGRYNAGCRGAGCRAARSDYDTHRWRIRTDPG